MFASGVVKLQSECPTWWGLTALDWHYQSQCIPTLFAYYAHNLLPQWFHHLSVVFVYVIEIIVPFFFLIPTQFGQIGKLFCLFFFVFVAFFLIFFCHFW